MYNSVSLRNLLNCKQLELFLTERDIDHCASRRCKAITQHLTLPPFYAFQLSTSRSPVSRKKQRENYKLQLLILLCAIDTQQIGLG